MEHHFIIALNKCKCKADAIKLLSKLNDEKRIIKLRANDLRSSNKQSNKLDEILRKMKIDVNKLTQISTIITLKIKERGQQEAEARRLLTKNPKTFSKNFVLAAAGVLNKKTFDKIKAIADKPLK